MDPEYSRRYARLETDHWWWCARRRIVTSTMLACLSPQARILEIGCGAGTNLAAWMEQGFRCEGVEPDEHLRRIARERTKLDIKNGTLPAGLPQTDFLEYDAVLLLDVLEHVEDDLEGVKAALALVRPGGWIFLNVPALPSMWSVHDEINHHHRRYLRSEFKALLNNAGGRQSSVRYWGNSLVPLARFSRRRRAGRSSEYSVSVPPMGINRLMELWTLVEFRLCGALPFLPGLSLFATVRK